jgi:putative membrane protein
MGPEPRRLHSAAIGVYTLRTLREAAVPLLALFAFGLLGRGFDAEALLRGALYAGLGTAASFILGYVRWVTTRWWVTPEAIHLRRSFIGTSETDVPLGRIQALDLQQGLVQRLFGVHSVHVQSGGGGAGGEIVLEALDDAEIDALRQVVAVPAPAPSEDSGARMSPRMLLLAALTAGQLGVILPLLAGAFQLFDNVLGEPDEDTVRLLPDTAAEWVLGLAALVIAAWLLSVLGAVVAFSGFTLARDGDRLRIRRGLVERREATVPVARVRAVEVVEGVFRRPFALATLRMEVIGHADEPTVVKTLFPLVRRAETRAFLDRFLPELADDPDRLARPPARALRRYALPPAALALAAAAAAWALTPAGPWPLLAVPLAGAYGAQRYRDAGWRLEDGRLAVRSARLARRTVLAPGRRRESQTLAQTQLQRRARLADVYVEFGSETVARAHHLDSDTAAGLFERLSRL